MAETKKILRTVAEITAASAASAAISIAAITTRDHRELTHASVELHPWLQAAADFEQRTYGVGESKVWAAVHRIHHSIPDATLYPFYTIARAINWAKAHPEEAQGVTIPDSFPHLDPYVDRFSRADVLKIGNAADELIKNRLGEMYEESEGYTRQELAAVLNPREPKYYYPRKKHVGPYSQNDVAEILLGDPHSPVRIPPPEENGLRGVLEDNVKLYTEHADMFRAHPEYKPEDLQGPNRKARKWEMAVGAAIPAVAVLLRRGRFTPKDFAIAAAGGAAIFATGRAMVVVGGNIVNSYGHAGELTQRTLVNAVRMKVFKPQPNPDGTVSTDTSEAGLLGWILGVLTLDEVGGQEEHHHDPAKIAYTSKNGLGAWIEAPYGKLVEMAADSKWVPFIRRGHGFDLKPGETRPDEPMAVMQLIHQRRAEQLQRVGKSSLK